MSGTGKTTVLNELRRRGHLAVDTDYGDWQLPDGTWDRTRMDLLLAENPNLVVSGTVENQGSFYDRFDHVVLLSAPIEILLGRVKQRDSNPYGKSIEQQAEIRHYTRTVEPLLRKGSTLELDAQRPASDLADAIEPLIGSTT
jgi:dephospho-CoA kinase